MSLFLVCICMLGLVVGSFLNVCISRLPAHRSIVFPGSSCTKCGHRLVARDLVPVISFIILRGRCRYCGERISPQYPIVEIATGMLYAAIVSSYGLGVYSFSLLVLVSMLIICAGTDFTTQMIPDVVTLPGIVIGLVFSAFAPDMSPLQSLIGILVSGGVVYLLGIASHGGMGGGDVKLMGMIGAFLGWKLGMLTLFIGALMGSIVGIGRIVSGKQKRRDPMPFGPYLSAAAVVSVFFGDFLLRLIFHQ